LHRFFTFRAMNKFYNFDIFLMDSKWYIDFSHPQFRETIFSSTLNNGHCVVHGKLTMLMFPNDDGTAIGDLYGQNCGFPSMNNTSILLCSSVLISTFIMVLIFSFNLRVLNYLFYHPSGMMIFADGVVCPSISESSLPDNMVSFSTIHLTIEQWSTNCRIH